MIEFEMRPVAHYSSKSITMADERPRKCQRTSSSAASLPTPPATEYDPESGHSKLLSSAVNVLATEAAALSHVTHLYQTDLVARRNFAKAVDAITKAQHADGKLVVCAVGKSGFIGMKFAATCKSFGVRTSFMHACEAAHGDLGDLRSTDVLLFVSYSGKTPELLNLLPHIPESTQLITISSQTKSEDCSLLRETANGILLPAPIHESEETSFGVGAPTTSTTVALAVTDMLALTIAEQMQGSETKHVFKRNHPGGAIGMKHQEVEKLKKNGVDFSILELPSPSISAEDA